MRLSQPNAEQRRWRERVRGLGSIISTQPAVIHHPVGRTGRHRPKGSLMPLDIGHWWIIPLTDEEHKALHAGEAFGYGRRQEFEKAAFEIVCHLLNDGPPEDVWEAIRGYHR